ncbi:methyltransferase [Fusarium langsethiae]|uniref:Methyltransferase n=1 Tax=Fusarium langsethiae TaxID=179993 RepID=A0A0N0DIG6_FUSLA|nr:methyltransferase [Fusarium langsethiae]
MRVKRNALQLGEYLQGCDIVLDGRDDVACSDPAGELTRETSVRLNDTKYRITHGLSKLGNLLPVKMIPEKPLPFNGDFSSPDEYIDELLKFVRTSETFQILCGGVHILDFFTIEPGLFHYAIPKEWHPFILSCSLMEFLDLLMRDDLEKLNYDGIQPPESFIEYVRTVRNLSLGRSFTPPTEKLPALPRSVAIGMNVKKNHEVTNFADCLSRLSDDIREQYGNEISHYVDFGSGQNYLGRVMASEPYNRHVVAVEGRENNVSAAKGLDMSSGLAVKPKVMRNKKLWTKILEARGPDTQDDPEALAKAIRDVAGDEAFEFKPVKELEGEYTLEKGKGSVQYISGRLDSGELGEVIAQINTESDSEAEKKDLSLMAMSIHSCGNLSHFGIRSLVLNPDIRAVAIVGCCYNLMTEKLGPPTYKHAFLRPTLQAVNGRLVRESDKHDPQGFPMSQKFSTYQGDGVRLNITARMMACQAPQNWTEKESAGFFSRHFYRAVLQKIFLDRGVVRKVRHGDSQGEQRKADTASSARDDSESPFDISTNPVIIGSLRKSCYVTFKSYVHGAVEKLTTNTDYKQYVEVMQEKMGNITDEEIEQYEAQYLPRKKELCAIWSLMAFSAMAVESLIVSDRWTFLKEHDDLVRHAWVETVFDYGLSPRNLVVVGVKR